MAETIKKYIKYNLLWLKLIGLWTNSDDFFATKYYWIYSVIVNVLFLGSFNLSQIIALMTTLDDLEKMASSAYVVLICSMANVKAFFYLKNWSAVRRVMKQLDQKDFQPKNCRQQEQTFQFMKVHIFFHGLYITMGCILGPLWLLTPFLGNYAGKRLPFPAWYPYDWTLDLNYIISYVHQALGLIFVIFTNLTLDLVTFGILAYIGVECDILSDTLRNLYEFDAPEFWENHSKVSCGNMNDTLVSCIHHHWKILRFAKDSNRLLNIIIFVQFASSLLSLCMSMFELTVLTPGSLEFSIIGVYQSGIFMELLVYCWFGNEAIVRSSKISSALYESDWLDGPLVFKRNMYFFMLRTERPIRILGLDFFVLSLTTFMAIVRTSWSFFAMLHQVHNRDNKE